ncbi:MAG: hypothetical protein HOV87_03345 [Catenulispora sp.]|nr:hypothetical protein [Catenulispora sp.]
MSGGTKPMNDFHGRGHVRTEPRPARPRAFALLDDTQRGAFLAQWDAVQTGFAADPRGAAEAAERLVGELADSVARRVAEIADAVRRPVADTATGTMAGPPAPDEETWRVQLLRCREAFHLLIDS